MAKIEGLRALVYSRAAAFLALSPLAAALLAYSSNCHAMIPPVWPAASAVSSGCTASTLAASETAPWKASSSFALSSDGAHFAYPVSDTRVRLGSRSTHTHQQYIPVTEGKILALRFLRGAHQLAVVENNHLRLIQSETGEVTNAFLLGSPLVYQHSPVKHIEFSENGFYVLLVSADNHLRLFETTSGREWDYVGRPGLQLKTAVANDGRKLLLSYSTGELLGLSRADDESDFKQDWKLSFQPGLLRSLQFSPLPEMGWLCVLEQGVLFAAPQFKSTPNQLLWTSRSKLNFGIVGEIQRAQFLGTENDPVLISFDAPHLPQKERLFALTRGRLAMTHEFSIPWSVPLWALSSDAHGIYALGESGALATYSVSPPEGK